MWPLVHCIFSYLIEGKTGKNDAKRRLEIFIRTVHILCTAYRTNESHPAFPSARPNQPLFHVLYSTTGLSFYLLTKSYKTGLLLRKRWSNKWCCILTPCVAASSRLVFMEIQAQCSLCGPAVCSQLTVLLHYINWALPIFSAGLIVVWWDVVTATNLQSDKSMLK